VTRDELFLETLRDLGTRTAVEASEYDVLRSSALLRQLLLDDDPLVHQVNRDRRLRLVFRTNVSEPIWKKAGIEPPAFWSRHDGLDPETALVPPEVAELKRDGLLASVVMIVDGRNFTVRDVVDQAAHVLGGVHAGKPREEAQEALSAVAAAFRIGNADPITGALRAISRIVLRALQPLRREIEACQEARW
jgi:hypothetical protein